MRAFVFIAALAFAGCGTVPSLQSSSVDEPVVVDAQLTEWTGRLQTIDAGSISIGIQNDGEYLYVGLSTTDPNTIGQVMQQGMILWVDPAGGKEQAFGVRYPIGVDATRGSATDPTATRIAIEQSIEELELIGSDGMAFRRRKDSVPGIEMDVQADARVMTYEAKIPLVAGEGIAYAAGARPGTTVGIGLTTPELDGQAYSDQIGRGGLPGGRMSSADGRSRYGFYNVPAAALANPMKHWMVVTLTAAP